MFLKHMLFDPDPNGAAGGGRAATLESIARGVGDIGTQFEKFKAERETEKKEALEKFVELEGGLDKLAERQGKELQRFVLRTQTFDPHRPVGVLARREAELIGNAVLAEFSPNKGVQKKAAEALKRIDPDYAEQRATGLTDATGQILSPTVLEDKIVSTLLEHGIFTADAETVPMSGDSQVWPIDKTEFTVGYPELGVAPPEGAFSLQGGELNATTWAVYILFPKSLEQDAVVALGNLVARRSINAISKAADVNGFDGDGSIGTAKITGALRSLNVQNHAMPATKTAFADLTLNDLIQAQEEEHDRVEEATWYMHKSVRGIIRQLEDTAGRLLIRSGLERGAPSELLGDPIRLVKTFPKRSQTAVGRSFILHGQLGQSHRWGVRQGIEIERSEHYKFPERLVAILVTGRFGISENQPDSVTKITTAAA